MFSAIVLVLALVIAAPAEDPPDFAQFDRETLVIVAKRQHEQIAQLKAELDELKSSITEAASTRDISQYEMPTEAAQALAEAKQSATALEIEALRSKTIPSLWAAVREAGRIAGTPAERRERREAAIAKHKAATEKLDRLVRGEEYAVPTLHPNDLRVGQVGRLTRPEGVEYSNSSTSAPVQVSGSFRGLGSRGTRVISDFRVRQVASPTEALIGSPYTNDFWLTNIDTSRLEDGQIIRLAGVYFVEGTKRYNTIDGGTKQVLLVREIVPGG